MSDSCRESFTDKAQRNMKPENEKGYGERIVDGAKETGDKLAGKMQPESEKSTSQKAGDTMTGNNSGMSGNQDESLMDKAKNAMGMGGNKN